MDIACAKCTNPESRRNQQVSRPPGEWLLFVDVDGLWRLWPRILPGRDGSKFGLGLTQDIFVAAGRPFWVIVAPHECDYGILTWTMPSAAMAPCPRSGEFGDPSGDDVPGDAVARFASPAAAIGLHVANGSTAPPSTCPPAPNPRGCYQLTYRISRVR
jgi:hypothetical protein